MKTRTLGYIGLVAGLAMATTSLKANSIVLYQDNYSYPVGTAGGSSGGEFNAVTSPTSFVGNGYTSQTAFDIGYGTGFETFCVQVAVEFNVTQTYNYTLGQSIQLGNSSQPLTLGAAYLYYLFATGNSSLGYDYVNTANRLADAGLLQSAIWDLEGGQSWAGDPFDPTTNPYYQLAVSTFGANVTSPSGGSYGVDVMELTDANGNPAQDQLVLVGSPSVPDGGSTVLLMGLGFAGLALAGFRLGKASA